MIRTFLCIIILSIFLFGCTMIQNKKLTEDELEAEAEIISDDDSLDFDNATNAVGQAYGVQSISRFLKCTESDNGKDFENFGKITISYTYKGVERTRTYNDECYNINSRVLFEYYCKENRPAKARYLCDEGCEDGACANKDPYPTLDLLEPEIEELRVLQNGVSFPVCEEFEETWCNQENPSADGTGPFEFNWGDGSISCSWFSGKHDYENAGNYQIEVRVKNKCGFISSRKKEVIIYLKEESWTRLSPDGGRFSRVKFHPTNSNIIYALTFGDGIHRTLDGGHTWETITGKIPENRINEILVDPNDPDAVYVGTTYEGIWKSEDLGNNWKYVNPPLANKYNRIGDMAISSDGAIFAASDGLYKSTDQGNTWTIIKQEPNRCGFSIDKLAIHPSNPNVIFVGGDCGRLLKTEDGGRTWEDLTDKIEGNDVNQIIILNNEENTIIVTSRTDSYQNSFGQIVNKYYRSDDNANTFEIIEYDPGYSWSSVTELKVDPTDPNKIFGGGVGLSD